MPESGQIRINELARELEIKAKVLIEYLPEVGITEKKTHSSSLENEQADRVRKHFRDLAAAEAAAESEKLAKTAAAKAKPAARPAASVPTAGAQATPLAAPPTAKPVVVPPTIPGVKAPIRPAAASPAGPRTAGAPTIATPAAGHPPAATLRTAAPSSGTPTSIPSQRPGAPSSQRSPIVTRPAASSPATTGSRPGSPAQGQQRPSGGYSRPGTPARPAAGAPSGYRPAAGAQGAPRPSGAPMRPAQRPSGRPGQPMGRPTGAAGQAPKAEPGKPLYVRKPPARAKPTIEKRFAEGERKLHPVRARAGAAAGRGIGHAEPAAPPVVREPRPVTITEGITVRELAEKLDIRAKELLKNLLDRGVFASINQALDILTATSLAEAFSGIVQVVSFEEQMAHEDVSKDDKSERLTPRAPVVTVMGHVDHGKTSLLDAIRSTDVAGGESGGITQHIGASDVHLDGKRIVFIDTPGHEAFTRMRARGAKVTDIVVLVVGADDGVMPQTEEAIDHARAAKVPIIVALNKIDKPDAQPERVKRQLADHGLMPEDWGGDTVMVEVSAKTKKNIERLLEMILLVGDLRELKSNPAASASGTVLESRVDKGRGPVATVLVQNGTLSVGDVFICGAVYGKVRALYDDRGQPVKSAGPSTPVEVLGLQGIPDAGDQFYVADEAKARHIVEYRQSKLREATLAKSASSRLTLDQLHEQLKAGEVKDLPIVIKGDVQGSVEVLSEMLPKLSNDQVKLKIIHASVGAVSETDVLLASASSAIIIAFNVRPERKASDLAQQEGVDIRLHTIIYEVVDEIKKAMAGLLTPVIKEQYLGRAEVRNTFRVKGVGMIAGCHIQDGIVKRDAEVRVLRDNVVVYTGRISSLRRFKDDVNEVRAGFECGISISNFADVKVGDILECFAMERTAHPGAGA
ncbi:MAG TPA: translation initiation factor IF-2 [Candidatus Acidoferrales bacterium]|nr:translation initiation factor IF-2 [Candidatus Acidoferrales bacterium]